MMAGLSAVMRLRAAASPPPRVLVAVVLSVFGAVLVGVAVSWIRATLTPVWLGTGVMVYWLLRTPRRYWPSIVAVCWLANVGASIAMGHWMPRAILLPTVNVIEAILVSLPLRLFRLDSDFARPRTLAAFYGLALGPATVIAASVGAFVTQRLTGTPFLQIWTEWYTTTALGQAVLVPPLMVLKKNSLAAIFRRELLPGTLLLLGIVAATIAINAVFPDYPLGFLFFPAVVLITFQRGFGGGAVALALVLLYMAGDLRDVHNAVSVPDARLHLLFAQLYIAAISFTVIVVGAGLAQRRRLERNLAVAREEAIVARDAAEAASRAKTMFLANMSHELRTPLNAVIGFSNLMHGELYGPLGHVRYREYAKSIQDAGSHLLEVIGDILDMSKIEAGRYEIFCQDLPLNALVRECLEIMSERAAERRITFALELAGPERIIADLRAIRQIMLNLLSNAIKFTPAGGVVTVATKVTDDTLILSVTDTGIGIPADDLPRLGRPFVQIGRATATVAQPGTGLGLALVRALAEMHGGTFVIESEDGQWTCAKIEIPLLVPAAPHIQTKNAA